MSTLDAYSELARRSRERSVLSSCAALLGWDEQTYMPRGGAEHRANQQALLAGLVHERAVDPRIGDLLTAVEASDSNTAEDSLESANVREWRRAFDRATKLPRALVEELARATSLGQQVWVEAKGARDFSRFQPALESIIELKRQEAASLGAGPDDYDALLDDYEPGAQASELGALFDGLRESLVPLIDRILGRPRRVTADALRGDYPIERQTVFCEAMAAALGFDFERGRLDVTAHPFCTEIGCGDVRITTRYDHHDFTDAFFSVLHETGHALYEQGLLPEHHGTPMGESVSLGVHESQSRLWENAVGRSLEFWQHAYPLARRVFHAGLPDLALPEFHAAVNRVEPSLIRVQADETTYNLHIIIRFELERALLSGDLPCADLPAAWSEQYRRNLGVEPAHDGEGCLQDVHWSAGLFGYFPTYTLGNIYGAQLFARAGEELADLPSQIARGEFRPLLDWLRTNVHVHGKRYAPRVLIERATGRPPDPAHLIDALRAQAERG